MDEAERLVAELDAATLGCRSHGGGVGRLRLAVTAGEYQAVRQRALARDGRFYARVRNIPLVIDDHAAKPPFFLEVCDGDSENQGRQGTQGCQDDERVQAGRAQELVRRDGNQPQAGDSD